MNIDKRSILLSLLAITLFASASYGQGIKAAFTPSARFFPGFGNVVVGKSKDQTIRIYNDTSSSGALNCSLAITGSTDYTISGPQSFSLNPGQADTVTVH